jgi:hypothetical protein
MKTQKLLVLAGLLTLSLGAQAQIFTIKVTDYNGADSFAPFKTFIDNEIQKIETDINKDLPSGPPQKLLEGTANSSVMAGKGIGSDYASRMEVALIGAGVGAGADLTKSKDPESDLSGAAVAPGAIIGVNLGFLNTKKILGMDTKRLNFYVNFMDYTLKQNLSSEEGKKSSAEIDMTSIGAHFKYDWIQGSGSKWLGWGGVKFHFGYEYNKNNITFQSEINEVIDETDSNGNRIQGTIKGNPLARINTATHSIPLELSTDVQLLYFLSLYTGVGVDYNFGQASAKGNLNADESDISCTNGSGGEACSTGPTIKVQADADISGTGKVTPFTSRAFVGAQVNLPYMVIFVQGDKSLGSNVIGATAGLRFVY